MSTERPDDARSVDDAVDQAWRATSNEGPSARIDAAILAAARAEVGREQERPVAGGALPARKAVPPRRMRWASWQPLAAAATVAGLAFVLVQTIPRDNDVAPAISIEQTAPAPARAPAVISTEATGESEDRETTTDTAAGAAPEVQSTLPAFESRSEAPTPMAPVPPPPAQTRSLPPAEAPSTASIEAAPAGVAAHADRALGRSRAAMEATASVLEPEAWAARIEELYGSGDRASAADELRAFRAAHPEADRHLAEALRDWAATVE